MSIPSVENIQLREEGSVLVATISRPEAMNALNAGIMKGLHLLAGWLEKSRPEHIRAVVLTGAGEKAFVAGADIKEFESMAPWAAAEFAKAGQAAFAKFEALEIPIIAAVNGFALGGGLELALSCDFIYASENAKFGLPECTLGLMPGYGGTVRLPRRIGPQLAREMSMTGGMITAAEAHRLGLVNKVLPQAELMAAAMETAQTIAARAPQAIARIKRSIREGMNTTETQAGEIEARLFGELFATEDKTEGVKAFIEKRKPQFKGK